MIMHQAWAACGMRHRRVLASEAMLGLIGHERVTRAVRP